MPRFRIPGRLLLALLVTASCTPGGGSVALGPPTTPAYVSGGQVELQDLSEGVSHTPVRMEDVVVIYPHLDYPSTNKVVARYRPRRAPSGTDQTELLAALRSQAASRGATTVVIRERGPDREYLLHHDPLRHAHLIALMARDSAGQPTTAATPATGGEARGSTGGPVQVRGYRRRDGTFVRPHTRARPRSGGRRRN